MIPIESRQIIYVDYDDQSSNLTAHYHTGETRTFHSISRDDYQAIQEAANKYDAFVKITTGISEDDL